MRAAFIYPFSVRIEEFFSDVLLSLCSADMKRAGHESCVLKVYYERDDAQATERARERLIQHVVDGQYDLVVYEWVWDLATVRRMRERAHKPFSVVLLDPISTGQYDEVDFLARRNLRTTFGQLVEALHRQQDTSTIPGLWQRRSIRLEEMTPAESERDRDEFLDYRPDLNHQIINDDFSPPITRRTLHGAPGCPHAKAATKNPFFSGIDLSSPQIMRLGCSFCHMGGDYQFRSPKDNVDRLLVQAERLLSHYRTVTEFIVRDNQAVTFLPLLIEESIRRGLRPVEYLFMTRADWLLESQDQIRQACKHAQDSGFRLQCYLIGFENFSEPELARYNKGESVQTLLDAVHLLRRLEQEFPDTFDRGRYRTHSLVLFNPWTELDDLECNIRVLREQSLGDLFCAVSLHKLRLYDSLPLYQKALAEGLVIDDQEVAGRDNAALFGYTAEIPWRFAHKNVERAYDLAEALLREVGNEREFPLLQAIVTLVRRQPEISVQQVLEQVRAFRPFLRPQTTDDLVHISFHGSCNNHCDTCPNHDRLGLSSADEVVLALAKGRAANKTSVVFDGREPTMRNDLPALIWQAREMGFSSVGLVTNGRRLAYRPYAQALLQAGLTSVRVKVFAADPSSTLTVTHSPESHVQGLLGLSTIARLGGKDFDCGARLVVTQQTQEDLCDRVTAVVGAGAKTIEFECRLDGLALDDLSITAAWITRATSQGSGFATRKTQIQSAADPGE